MPQPAARSATTGDGFEGSDFGNQFIFDEDNMEKFDILDNSRLKSLIINDDSDLRSPLDLIQEDFPSTPSAIFDKVLAVDEAQVQEQGGSSSGPSSPLREKPVATTTTTRSPAESEKTPEGKDELDDVLDDIADIDQAMSDLYVAEESPAETSSAEPPYPSSPHKQSSSSASAQSYPLQYPNGHGHGQVPYAYPPYSGQHQTQQQFSQQSGQHGQLQLQPHGDAQGQGQQFANYPSDVAAHSQQQQGQPVLYPPQGQYPSPQLQGQMQQQQVGGFNPSRGQMAASTHPQQGAFEQPAVVNPGMAMGMEQQNGYYMNVMPNGAQQPMYMDPYYQGRMNVTNTGAYPQLQPEVAYSNASAGGDGMAFMQYGQPPNAVGSYWTPQGTMGMNPDPSQLQQQHAMLLQQQQRGQGQQYPAQYNAGIPPLNQQQMNMVPRNGNTMMSAHMSAGGNNGYPQQNLQNNYVNGPGSPNRGVTNMQSSLSPSKGQQGGQMGGHDGYRQDNGGSGDMLDEGGGHSNRHPDRRGYHSGGRGGGRASPIMPASGGAAGSSSTSAAVTRDPVVEDFRNTYGKGRQWEIRDLVGHVVAFCQDQHGSRFIQQRLEVATDPDKQIVFDEVLPSAHSLMTDVFGNYVIQKLFEFGTPDQCETLAALLMGQAVPLALQMYGCRVIQKALEYVATKRLVALVGEFEGQQVLRCVHDQNGNHVIQKCIEVVSRVAKESQPDQQYLSSRIQFIIQAFSGKVRELSMHPYGCRVVQRILEHCTNTQKAPVLDELRKCCRELIQDQYGNYVIQHVMQHGWEADKAILIDEVQSRLLEYSQHKFASNVVEKCIQYADKKDRDQMIWTIINVTFDLNNPVDAKTGQCVLENMVRDPYANYVVQKVIDVSDTSQRGAIIRYMRENIVQLRRYTYGKHIIIRLEKVSGEKF